MIKDGKGGALTMSGKELERKLKEVMEQAGIDYAHKGPRCKKLRPWNKSGRCRFDFHMLVEGKSVLGEAKFCGPLGGSKMEVLAWQVAEAVAMREEWSSTADAFYIVIDGPGFQPGHNSYQYIEYAIKEAEKHSTPDFEIRVVQLKDLVVEVQSA